MTAPVATCSATDTTIIATFDTVVGATGYLLRYGTTNPPQGNGTAYASGDTITGLAADTTYYLQTKSTGDGEFYTDSDWSDVIAQATLGPPPKPLATASSQYVITITWPDYGGQITLERTQAASDHWDTLGDVTNMVNYNDTTAQPGIQYLYRLRSGDDTSESDPAWLSTIVHFSFIAEANEVVSGYDSWDYITDITV